MNISGNFCFLSAFILFSGHFLHSYPILLGFFKAFFSQNMDQTLKNFVNAIAHILDIAVLRKFGHILEEYGGILLQRCRATADTASSTCIFKNSLPEKFFKKVFLQILQNSQESICAGVSF